MRTDGPRVEGVTGAVLCGGAGRRMGRDKAEVPFAGETLLARAVRTLAAVFDEVLVVGRGSVETGLPPHVRAVPDERAGLGPVGGIATALAAASHDRVFVCACDMPLMDAHAVVALADLASRASGPEAVAPRAGGNTHPLAAFYSRRCLEAARAALEAGRLSARDLLVELRAAYIDLDPGSEIARALTNVNTPEELARAERELERSGRQPMAEGDSPIRVAIVIPSDRAHSGERPDATGPALAEAARALPAEVVSVAVVPDERVEIAARIAEAADRSGADVVLVAGGTGLGPRDVTPEATADAVDREAPGIAELIRARGLEVTPRACLSRAVAGVRGRTLVIDLPGSPKGAVESLGFVAGVLPHAVAMLRGGGH